METIKDLAVQEKDYVIEKLATKILNHRIKDGNGNEWKYDYAMFYDGCLITVAALASCAPNIDTTTLLQNMAPAKNN